MKKILIIDNSLVVRSVIKKLFTYDKDILVYEASNFYEAKDFIAKHDFFVVSTNLTLPDCDRFQILGLLSKKNIPTIIFSSRIQSDYLDDYYPNIIDYVLKDANGFKYIHKLILAMKYCYKKEVLVVEDSKTQSLYTKNILEKILLKVTTVENGVEALKALEKNTNFSLILSDYETPDMNGFELTKHIRVHKIYDSIPIIIITSNTSNELKTKFYKHGVNDIIYKPILPEELIVKVIDIFLNIKHIEDLTIFNSLVDKNIITSITDKKGIITSVSEAFCEISGYTKEELIGKNHNIVRHPDTPKIIFEEMWKTLKSGNIWKGEIKNQKKDGSFYWVKAVIEPIFSDENEVLGYTAIRYDITDKKIIETISITDSLTEIYNRRYFDEIFPKIINSARRKNELVCFLFIDIDHFKQYNDNYGHQEGDTVLKKFATCLKNNLHRASDLPFRFGGEEFAVVYQADTKEKAIYFANLLRTNIENLKIEHKFNSASPYITASMGLLCKNANDYDESFYKEADELLYKAKKSGRNQLQVNEK